MAIENTAELVKHLMSKHQIPINNVVQHHGAKGVTWNKLISTITNEKKSDIQPSKRTVEDNRLLSKTVYNGDSIIDYLNSIGIDASQTNRKKLVTQWC